MGEFIATVAFFLILVGSMSWVTRRVRLKHQRQHLVVKQAAEEIQQRHLRVFGREDTGLHKILTRTPVQGVRTKHA